MSYVEHAPRADLVGVVRCVWRFTAETPDPEPQRIAPDGCTELIVHLGAPYAEGDGALQPLVLFAGQLTRPLTLTASGPTDCIGVRFEPDGARGFLGRPLVEATDRRIDLAAFHADALREASGADAFDVVQDHVAARDVMIDAEVRAAVDALANGEAIASTLSERALQRRFAEHVGVAPRMLASIFRFRRVFDAIERPETPGWLEAALAAGYFDQPQMARDFRRFLGCTASEWARRQSGLARAIAASETYKRGEAR